MDAAAICAAMLDSFSRESVATKQISFTRMPRASAIAVFNCSASSAGLAFPVGNAWINLASSACVTCWLNCTLANPAAESNCANCFSAGAPSNGTPSSNNCAPDAPNSKPVSAPSGIAIRNSFHATVNCSTTRACSYPYRRANFSNIFRLRTNARAAVALGSVFIQVCDAPWPPTLAPFQ
jgi:hypothetical protein